MAREPKLPSIKENLTPEAWWAIKIHMGALAAFMGATIFLGFTSSLGPFAVWVAFLIGFLDSLYWVVYIKRGIDRRFERDEIRRQIMDQSKKGAGFSAPEARLLSGDPSRSGGAPVFPAPKQIGSNGG